MKTERITMLATPAFKNFLSLEAERENVSVAELIRARFEPRPSEDEAMLIALTAELRTVVGQAKKTLREGLAEVDATLATLSSRQTTLQPQSQPQPVRKSRAKRAA